MGENWAGEELRARETVEHQGRARIEFHGDNVAETIEGEEERRVARDRDQETSMGGPLGCLAQGRGRNNISLVIWDICKGF